MAAKYDGSIRINTKIDQAGAQVGLKTLTASLKNFAVTMGVAFGVGAIVNFSKECIDLASDLTEVQNVIETTFGGSVGLIESFADIAAVQFGLSELAAKQYTGTMGAMLKSMGFAERAAADMSIEMASLAGDMASFYNLSTDEAFEKIRSGISGETEPLKQLGVNLSEANLSAFALAEGMGEAYSKMSEQEKALTRFNYLMSVTADAQGDFAKTSNSWANQVRVLKLQWDSFKGTLGKAFINVLTPVLQFLNTLLGRLNAVATVFANFVAAITGNAQQVTTATTEATDAVTDLGDATTETGAAAKKAGKSLAAFDELNTLSDGSGGGSVTGLGLDIVTDTTENTGSAVEDANRALEEFKSNFDFTNLIESLNNLKESLDPFREDIGSGLKYLYENVLQPLAKFDIEYVLPTFLQKLADALWSLGEMMKPFKLVWDWFSKNVLDRIEGWGDTEAGKKFQEFFSEGLVDGLLVASGPLGQFVALFAGLKPVIQGVEDKWAEWSPKIKEWYENDVAPWFTKEKWTLLFDTIRASAEEIWLSIQAIWGSVSQWFKENVSAPLSAAFEELKTGILNVWGGIWTGTKGFINSIIGAVESFANAIVTAMNTVIKALNTLSIDVPDWVTEKFGIESFGFNISTIRSVSIPRLAQGAVIPPNREFMAVLGDQKHGTNIEAPLTTIEAALRNVLREKGNSNSSGTIVATFVINGREWAKLTAPYNAEEDNRLGTRLIDGVI